MTDSDFSQPNQQKTPSQPVSALDVTFQNLRPVAGGQAIMAPLPGPVSGSQQPANTNWYSQKTTPEFNAHADRLMLVDYNLKQNPQMYTQEERNEQNRLQMFRKLSYFELGVYTVLLFMGKSPRSSSTEKVIFASARQRYVFLRILFLNLALTTHICSIYKESQLRTRLANKYFSAPFAPVSQVPLGSQPVGIQ